MYNFKLVASFATVVSRYSGNKIAKSFVRHVKYMR